MLSTVVPDPTLAPTSNSISGKASWYCRAGQSVCVTGHPDTRGYDAFAAAGPQLRLALGGGIDVHAPQPWKGRIVFVDGIRVKLIDWCACLLHDPNEKIIDLYHDVFFGDRDHAGAGGQVTIRW